MLNKDIPKDTLSNLKMVVFDSDGVAVERGTFILQKESRGFVETNMKINKVSNEMTELLKELKKKIKVCFSSGRDLMCLQSMYGPLLGQGTILQAENGNISLLEGKIIQHFDYNEDYFKKIFLIKEEIKRLPILGFETKQFILTVHSKEEFSEVYEIVKKYDQENNLQCMWNGEAFDIQKKEVSKGSGLEKLLQCLDIKKEEVVAIGDRINDKELLDIAGVGVSADIDNLKAEYFTKTEKLGGGVLAQYLLDNL